MGNETAQFVAEKPNRSIQWFSTGWRQMTASSSTEYWVGFPTPKESLRCLSPRKLSQFRLISPLSIRKISPARKTNVSTCGGFVNHDPDTQLVTFSHETVRPFLKGHESLSRSSHLILSRTCLAYLRLLRSRSHVSRLSSTSDWRISNSVFMLPDFWQLMRGNWKRCWTRDNDTWDAPFWWTTGCHGTAER